MAFIGVDLHSNRFTVARMDVKSGKLSIMKETYTFEDESYRRFEESHQGFTGCVKVESNLDFHIPSLKSSSSFSVESLTFSVETY